MRKGTTKKDRPYNVTTCWRMEQQLYHNAHNLLTDACILYQHKSYPTAFALAVLAYEELGKLHLLDHINGESWGFTEQRNRQLDRFFSSQLGYNHRIKQSWALTWTPWKGDRQYSAKFHDGHLDRLKQACFYVGFRKGRITTPDCIKARTAYNQIKRVLKLARNTEYMPFLTELDDKLRLDVTPEDQRLVKSYMRKAERAVASLRRPMSKRKVTAGPRDRMRGPH